MRILTLISLVIVAVSAACVGEDRMETNEISIEREAAEFVEVDLILSKGNFDLSGGDIDLFEGSFYHQTSDFKPHYEYEVEGTRGHLIVEQPSVAEETESGDHYVTTMQLANDVPMDLHLTKTDGDASVNLQGLRLNLLDVHMGERQSVLSLVGEYPSLTRAYISASEGVAEIMMDGQFPSLVELNVELEDDHNNVHVIGNYEVLENFTLVSGGGQDAITIDGDFPELLSLEITTFNGDDTIQLNGNYPLLGEATIDVGSGADFIDLTGDWQHDLQIEVISRSDTTRVHLPDDVGVIMHLTNRTTTVEAGDLQPTDSSDTFVNAAYGTSDVTITLTLNTSGGDVINEFSVDLLPEAEEIEATEEPGSDE